MWKYCGDQVTAVGALALAAHKAWRIILGTILRHHTSLDARSSYALDTVRSKTFVHDEPI